MLGTNITKTIVLLSDSQNVQNWVNNFLSVRKVKKIAYIMDAKKPRLLLNPDYVFEDKADLERAGFEVVFISLEDLDPETIETKFVSFDAIYVKGGNSFYLLRAMKESGFDKVIHSLVDQGIIYIGESAGTYVACPTIEMANWKQQDKNIVDLEDLTALNLVPFLVTVHYKKEYEQVINQEISESKFNVKILTDNDLLLVEDGVTQLITI